MYAVAIVSRVFFFSIASSVIYRVMIIDFLSIGAIEVQRYVENALTTRRPDICCREYRKNRRARPRAILESTLGPSRERPRLSDGNTLSARPSFLAPSGRCTIYSHTL